MGKKLNTENQNAATATVKYLKKNPGINQTQVYIFINTQKELLRAYNTPMHYKNYENIISYLHENNLIRVEQNTKGKFYYATTKPTTKSVKEIIENAKKVGYVGLTNEERNVINPLIKEFGWKHEGKYGPLFVELTEKEFDSFMNRDTNIMFNYQNSIDKNSSGGFYAEWCSYSQAERIAKKIKVNLERY